MAPLSVTLTATISASVVSPVRVSVNAAAVPSVTGLVPAVIEIAGRAASLASIVTLAEPIAAPPCRAATATVSAPSGSVSSTAVIVVWTEAEPVVRTTDSDDTV